MNCQHTKIVIVGSGFSGLGMGAKLKENGFHDFVILEQAQEIGGTWRDNSYPGAECDVPSPVYSFSFFKTPRWSQLFGKQSEIFSYLKEMASTTGLVDHIRLGTRVTRAEFVESLGCWQVETQGGERWTSQFLILGTGGLSRPLIPQFKGMERFRGTIFHTALWDHSVPLAGKSVGVIGNGASGIQVVPAIVDDVKRLVVFQRTASWILPKMRHQFTRLEQEIFARFPVIQSLVRFVLYALFEIRAMGFFSKILGRIGEKQAIRYLRHKIKDPVLRGQLTPKYRMGCKRVLLSNNYFDALTLDKTSLVTSAIKEISETGITTADGTHHHLDALVCATGFKVVDEPLPFPIVGLKGRSLQEVWDRDGVEAFLGTTVAGFPNLAILMGPNTGLGHNSMVYMIESQISYFIQAISYTDEQKLDYIDVKSQVQYDYNIRIQKKFTGSVWSEGGCKSWYQNKQGRIVALWPGFSFTFRQKLKKFDPVAYECSRLILVNKTVMDRESSDQARSTSAISAQSG